MCIPETEDRRRKLEALAIEAFLDSLRVLQRKRPGDPEYQEELRWLRDDTSPWHQLLGIERKKIDKFLSRFHQKRSRSIV